MTVLALEPWYGGSHRGFLDGFVAHSRHRVEAVTMAARFWKWRMHGGAVTLARKAQALADGGVVPDVVFASSMVNVPALLALARRVLAGVPVVLFMHENQLTYPLPPEAPRDLAYGYVHYLSALAADRVVFNSEFHRREFLAALPVLLHAFPDYTHFDTIAEIEAKSSVLHLGLPLSRLDAAGAGERRAKVWGPGMAPPVVLWNHRWEYDKNPEAFFRLLGRLDDIGVPFRLILAGKHFERQPEGFEEAMRRYAGRIEHYGYAEDFDAYARLLHGADLVVSTSRHEFFGVAMLEAIHCGCHPLLPNRLSYPELVPEALHRPLLHTPVLYDSDDDLFHIAARLLSGESRPLPHGTLRGVSAHLDWPLHVAAFDDLLEQAAMRG